MSELKLLDPRAVRGASEVEVDLGDGTMVMARRQDMTMMVFEGRVPMPMLNAVQRMVEMPNATPQERVATLGSEGRNLVELLRSHAVAVVTKPKMVLVDTGDPDVIPVEFLNIQQLMAIWNATAVVPKFGALGAARFRGGAGTDAPPAVAIEPDLPPATERVVDGRVYEYIGK